ncbi:hypothetical protein LXL04_040130 [Taraxacum kok-saghyz]
MLSFLQSNPIPHQDVPEQSRRRPPAPRRMSRGSTMQVFVPLRSTIPLFFYFNGRKFPSKKLGYLHTLLRFLRIESRDSNFNIVSNPPVRIMRENKVSIKNSSTPPNPNIPCYRT